MKLNRMNAAAARETGLDLQGTSDSSWKGKGRETLATAGPSRASAVQRAKPSFRSSVRRDLWTSSFADNFRKGLDEAEIMPPGWAPPASVEREQRAYEQAVALNSHDKHLSSVGQPSNDSRKQGHSRSPPLKSSRIVNAPLDTGQAGVAQQSRPGRRSPSESLQERKEHLSSQYAGIDQPDAYFTEGGDRHEGAEGPEADPALLRLRRRPTSNVYSEKAFNWPDGVAPMVKDTGQLVGVLRRVYESQPGPATLAALVDLHDAHLSLATTASFNVLLSLASVRNSNFKVFNALLGKMAHRGLKRDSTTWDLLMESYASNGKWKELVESYERREHARCPITKIGWTRVVRAATREGSTSLQLPDAKVDGEISPLYGAAYGGPGNHHHHLPYGVRQATLRSMLHHVKMDVDRLLAAMMPPDMLPLDFHATAVVGQRLAKQRRWREAYDLVGDWLDTASKAAATAAAAASQNTATATGATSPTNAQLGGSATAPEHSYRQQQQLQQRGRTLLHILIEGLVISRTEPSTLRSFIDSVIEQHASSIGIRPSFHTIYLLLGAYRAEPIDARFSGAKRDFESAVAQYKPDLGAPSAELSLVQCLRRLKSYAKFTELGKYKGKEEYAELVERTRQEWTGIEAQVEDLRRQARQRAAEQRQKQLSSRKRQGGEGRAFADRESKIRPNNRHRARAAQRAEKPMRVETLLAGF